MSHTLHPLRKQRLHRSELAVPASNPAMVEKAADSAADYVFLDLEDAVAPPEKDQARKNAVELLNDIDWAGKGKTVSVRINGLDTHYMYRDVRAPYCVVWQACPPWVQKRSDRCTTGCTILKCQLSLHDSIDNALCQHFSIFVQVHSGVPGQGEARAQRWH